MSLPLEEHDIQTLCHKFGIPDLVKSWLTQPSEFHMTNEYALHEQICNLHPEDALLCIALCLNIIHKKHHPTAPVLGTLLPLTADIITNYGPEAMERMNLDIPNEERSNIEYVARDLSALTRALESTEATLLEQPDNTLSIIMSALSIQAGAQAEIARYVLENFREQEQKNKSLEADPVPFMKTFPVNDNKRA
jgi:hypothetical protein